VFLTMAEEGDSGAALVPPGQGSSSSTALRGDRPSSQPLLDASVPAVAHDHSEALSVVHRHRPRATLGSDIRNSALRVAKSFDLLGDMREFATQDLLPGLKSAAATARAASPSKQRMQAAADSLGSIWGNVGRASGALVAKTLSAGYGQLPSAEQVVSGVASSHAAFEPARKAISDAQASAASGVRQRLTAPGAGYAAATLGAEAHDQQSEPTWHDHPVDESQRLMSRLWHADDSTRRFMMEQFEHLSDDALAFVPTNEDALRLFKLVFEAAYEGDRLEGGIPSTVIRSFLLAAHKAPGVLGQRIREMQAKMDKGHLQESMKTSSSGSALRRNRPVDPARHVMALALQR